MLTRMEATRALRVSERTMDRMIADGRMPTHRAGKIVRIDEADLLRMGASTQDVADARTPRLLASLPDAHVATIVGGVPPNVLAAFVATLEGLGYHVSQDSGLPRSVPLVFFSMGGADALAEARVSALAGL